MNTINVFLTLIQNKEKNNSLETIMYLFLSNPNNRKIQLTLSTIH